MILFGGKLEKRKIYFLIFQKNIHQLYDIVEKAKVWRQRNHPWLARVEGKKA